MNEPVLTAETLRSLILILSGAFIGSISTWIVTWITKRSDERKHLRELIIKTAVENWKNDVELAKRQGGLITPLDVYIIHMMSFVEKIGLKKIKPEKIEQHIIEIDEIVKKALKAVEKKEKQGSENKNSQKE